MVWLLEIGKIETNFSTGRNCPFSIIFFWQLDYYLNFINTKNEAEGDNSLEDIAS